MYFKMLFKKDMEYHMVTLTISSSTNLNISDAILTNPFVVPNPMMSFASRAVLSAWVLVLSNSSVISSMPYFITVSFFPLLLSVDSWLKASLLLLQYYVRRLWKRR